MIKKTLAFTLSVLVLGWSTPAQVASGDLLGDRFEEFTGIPRAEARALGDDEMDDLRGGFLGFFFSVNFAGFVENAGAIDGSLTVNAGFMDASGTQSDGFSFNTGEGGDSAVVVRGRGIAGSSIATVTNPVTGEAFNVAAIIDSSAFSNSNVIAQISQVPGSGNDIRQALVINLAIIEAREADFGALRARLAPMFGLR